MPYLDDDVVRSYLKPHAHAMVERALAEYPTLSACIAILSLSDDAPPRLIARATAGETLRSLGYPSYLLGDLASHVRDDDDLAVIVKGDGPHRADVLTSQHGKAEPSKPMAVPPCPRTGPRAALPENLAATVKPLQEHLYQQLREATDTPGEFMLFWPLFESSPTLLTRDSAKATLGKHPKWKQILPYVYTPSDDLLVLLEVDGALVPIDRERTAGSPAMPQPTLGAEFVPVTPPSAGRPELHVVPMHSATVGAAAATKPAKPKKREVEKYARRYLKTVVETCAREHREPRDYYLLIGKYEPERGLLIPRALAEETIAIAKSAVGREKMRRLVARPCEPKQLLVIITAGDHVEGDFIRVPTIAPDPDKVFVTREEMDAIESYQRLHAPAFAHVVDERGHKLADYVAILRPPDREPVFGTRENARATLEANGFGEVTKELDVPAKNDDELLCVYKVKGKPTWTRLQYLPREAHPSGNNAPDSILSAYTERAKDSPERAAYDDARNAVLAEFALLRPTEVRTQLLEAALNLVLTASRMCMCDVAASGIEDIQSMFSTMVEDARNGRVPEQRALHAEASKENMDRLELHVGRVFAAYEGLGATPEQLERVDAVIQASMALARAEARPHLQALTDAIRAIPAPSEEHGGDHGHDG